ncbi:phage-like protein [Yersinia frederiksenii]|uniref:hypothetical protein n=1 Tax=Yersinia TaxID=629 RepID=UPI0005DD68EE|nr:MULTISPECIES: hypothetical protein [Yersinia]CNB66325.1 phage-like protein [Yersinia frederiksenii]CNK67817.1 phage-like protein [Yersinia frederiksenii]CNL54621.1 phage-like protein [Yersinia frederiksenii]
MINMKNLIQHLPLNGAVLIHCKNGKIVSIKQIRADQFVASLPAFIELAERAGYIVTNPDI